MMDWLPPSLRESLGALSLTLLWATIGRMLWHVRQVQRRERPFFGPHLIYEGVTAIGIGFAADGVVSWLGFTGDQARAVVILTAYLGPGGIEHLFWRVFERYAPKP